MYNKPIIVFEGVEGSGKTYHIKKVAKFLKNKKLKFVSIREPGGSKNSEKIRKLILNKKSDLDRFTDLLLYLASRNENIEKIIKKNYRKKIILIDRFIDSTIAYQHYGMGLNKKMIQTINNFFLKKISIDFTFLNIVSMNNLKIRLKTRKNLNKYDKFNTQFYNKVQRGFIRLSKINNRYLIVNSNNNIKENEKIILSKFKSLIKIK